MRTGQSECSRCEKLFVFFYRTNRPIYCKPCSRAEREDAREFFTQRNRLENLMKQREELAS